MSFAIIFFLLFSVLAWKRLPWALMLLLAGLPSYVLRFKVAGLPSTILEGMILIAFAVWFLKDTRFVDFIRGRYKAKEFFSNSPFARNGGGDGRMKYPFGIELSLLLIVSLVAVAVSGFSFSALGIWRAYFLEPALLYILIINVFGRRTDGIHKIVFSLAIGSLFVSACAVFQKITGFGIDNPLWSAPATRRVVSFFGYPNAVGLYLAPIVPVLMAFLFFKSDKKVGEKEKKFFFPLKVKDISALGLSRGFLGLIVLLSLLSVYYAHSEGALIGLAAAFFVVGLLLNSKTRLAVLACSVLFAVAIFFVPQIGSNVLEKATLRDFSGQVRRAQWAETWKMLKSDNRLLIGAGLAGYQKAVEPYHVPGIFYDDGTDPKFRLHVVFNDDYKKKVWRPVEVYLYPHNIVLNFWSELGLAGLLLFLWIFVKTIYLLSAIIHRLKIKKDYNSLFLPLGLLGAVIVVLVHGLVDVPYFKNDLACLFWVFIALIAVLKLKLTSDEKSIK